MPLTPENISRFFPTMDEVKEGWDKVIAPEEEGQRYIGPNIDWGNLLGALSTTSGLLDTTGGYGGPGAFTFDDAVRSILKPPRGVFREPLPTSAKSELEQFVEWLRGVPEEYTAPRSRLGWELEGRPFKQTQFGAHSSIGGEFYPSSSRIAVTPYSSKIGGTLRDVGSHELAEGWIGDELSRLTGSKGVSPALSPFGPPKLLNEAYADTLAKGINPDFPMNSIGSRYGSEAQQILNSLQEELLKSGKSIEEFIKGKLASGIESRNAKFELAKQKLKGTTSIVKEGTGDDFRSRLARKPGETSRDALDRFEPSTTMTEKVFLDPGSQQVKMNLSSEEQKLYKKLGDRGWQYLEAKMHIKPEDTPQWYERAKVYAAAVNKAKTLDEYRKLSGYDGTISKYIEKLREVLNRDLEIYETLYKNTVRSGFNAKDIRDSFKEASTGQTIRKGRFESKQGGRPLSTSTTPVQENPYGPWKRIVKDDGSVFWTPDPKEEQRWKDIFGGKK